MNNLNFNPVFVETDDGLVFETNNLKSSYKFDFNEKTVYERGNTTLISGWCFLISNLVETYTRTYPKFQGTLANVGGALKAILMIAQIINFLFNQWTIIVDIQKECNELGIDKSQYDNQNLKKSKININHQKTNTNMKNNYFKNINKNTSQVQLNSLNNISSKMKELNTKNNFDNNIMPVKIDNYIDKKIDKQNTSKLEKNIKLSKKIKNGELKNKIGFFSYLKSIFNKNGKSSYNIILMSRFWINKISEENIVHMDLNLYKLSFEVRKNILRQSEININNLIKGLDDNSFNENNKNI